MTENTPGGTAASSGTPEANPQQAPATTPDVKKPVEQPTPDKADQPQKS